jgi:V/A-type H+-transporting ATPase subunit E
MADEIKALVEKIQKDGVDAARQKAQEIEADARSKAEALLNKAASDAQKMLDDAQDKIKRMEDNSRAGLKQAGRDLLLSVRKELNSMLESVIRAQTGAALSAGELSSLIAGLVEKNVSEKGGVIVWTNAQDKQRLADTFLSLLKDEVRKGVSLRVSHEIKAGFAISFDAGKSQFEFSDKSLAEYFGGVVKPALAEYLKV